MNIKHVFSNYFSIHYKKMKHKILTIKGLLLWELWLYSCLIITVFHQPVYALTGQTTRFERLSLEEGLSQVSVADILQDKKGFLWVGTQDGLNRYDGYEFKIYKNDVDDPTSISDNWQVALYEDRAGIIWIGTLNGGLNRFDPKTERFISFRHDENDPYSISHDRILSIHESKSGVLWVGTQNGLNKFDPATEKFTNFHHDKSNSNSLIHNRVLTIYEDQEQNLWIGTKEGLDKFDPLKNQFIHFQHDSTNPDSLSHNRVVSIYEDDMSVLWVATDGGGLNKFDSKTETFTHFRHDSTKPNSLSNDNVKVIYKASEHSIWVGTYGGGLNLFDLNTESFKHFRHDETALNSLSDDRVLSIVEDRTGIFWIGTKGAGLNKLNPSTSNFQHFKANNKDPYSLNANSLSSIYITQREDVWIGTINSGLNKYNPLTQRFSQFIHDDADPSSLNLGAVTAVYEDSNNVIWAGTYGGGLHKFDPVTESFVHFIHDENDPDSLSNDRVWFIYEDSKNNFWIGTSAGLNKYDRNTGHFQHFIKDDSNINSLSYNAVNNVYEGPDGILWFSTFNGLNRYDATTDSFTRFLHDDANSNSLSSNLIWSVHGDSSGVIWIGTAGGGLNIFYPDTGKFKHYREKQGLANDNVYSIVNDNLGNLWLSTNNGLSKFDPKTETFKNYTVNDGLQSNEFNAGAYARSEKGELFFGGVNGLNRFFPENIKEDAQAPIVVITDFLLFNQTVPLQYNDENSPLSVTIADTHSLRLNYQQSIFSFEFSALHFAVPKNNKYAYKLEGFDQNWITTDASKRFATYTSMPAGEYVFRVKASNKDGVWNEVGTSINITIMPPPWQTWWAYLLYSLIIIGIIAQYIHAQRSKQKQLEALVKERTKELAKLTTAVEQSPASVMITNLEGAIEYVNPKFCQVTGYTEAETLEQNALFTISQQSSSDHSVELWATLNAGNEWHGEFLNQKKDGTLFWESSLFSPIFSDNGAITHYLAVKEDITERKAMEIQLKQAKAAAEDATKTKSDFLANMSHEIRTPMNAIIGMSHLALQTDLNRKQKDYVNKINTAANSLLGIINDILDFSKIEAGKMDMEAVPFSLSETLNDLTQLITGKIQEQGLELLIGSDADVPDGLIGDSLRLRQILINLANNAVKFTPEGEIIIRIEKNVETKDQVTLQFSITDSGIGMTEKQMNKLFQSFSQADTSTTRKYGGTGLGLTISKTLTEMMGGKIWVESTKGEGTAFYFTANFGLSNEISPMLSQPKMDLRGLSILVVDDSPSAREIMQHLAHTLSFEVELVASGEEALERIQYKDEQGEPFKIVFMDWKMPGMSGIEACHHIKSDTSLIRPPKVVMVTAYDKDDVLQQLDGEEPDGFLSKPVSESSLLTNTMMVLGYEEQQTTKSTYELELEAVAAIRGAHILLVDDNEINQQVGAELLELAKMVVTIANNGKSAIEQIQAGDFDLVLMDIQMPIMDGYAATKELRKDPQYAELPIIAMTANALTTDRDKCLAAGMNEHIAKPIDPNLLYRTLADWIKPGEREIPSESLQEADLADKSDHENESKPTQADNQSPLNLPGFDTDSAILRMGGSVNAYRKILNKALESEADVIERLQQSMANEDKETSIRIVHTLKGVAGTLGANVLHSNARELESALMSDKATAQLILQTKQTLDESLNIIRAALQAEKASLDIGQLTQTKLDNVAVMPELSTDVISALEQISTSVDNYDATAEEAVEQLLITVEDAEICKSLKKLQRYLSEYDFDSAADLLKKILS